MKNIHVLPTDKLSRLYTNRYGGLKLFSIPSTLPIDSIGSNQHIYITSSEEIKEGDWVYYENGDLKGTHKIANGQRPKTMILNKIILTTDQDLIDDGVQAITNTFAEWFIKNTTCECVNVEKIEINIDYRNDWKQKFRYEIIFPQEEPKTNLERLPFPKLVEELSKYYEKVPLIDESKQETLEDAAKDLAYWRANAEEDYMKVPISVLKYITELEKAVELNNNTK